MKAFGGVVGLWVIFSVAVWAGIPCKVWMLNGDRLDASYLGLEGERCVFQSEWQERPIRIHGKYIDVIDFGRKTATWVGDRTLYFQDDQWIRGEIKAWKAGQVQLQTAWADSFWVDLGYVKKIEHALSEEAMLYQGPGDLKNWRFHSATQPVDLNEISSKGWRLPAGDSVLSLPGVEGAFAIRLVFRLPVERPGDLGGFTLKGFSKIADPGKRVLRFAFIENGIGIERQSSVIFRGGQDMRQVVGVNPLQASGREVTVKIVYNEARNTIRIKVGDEVILERGEEALPNANTISRPVISFMVPAGSDAYALRDIFYYRVPDLDEGSLSEDAESVLFVNGDVFKAQWQGIDLKGNWLLKGQSILDVTSIDPSRIFAWRAERSAYKPLRRKARHVWLQLAGSADKFLVEFLKADAENFYFRREGIEGAFSIPFSRIERLGFNPYFR